MAQKSITLFFVLLLFSASLFGQAVDLPITVADNGTSGNSQVLNIGLDPTATDGIDGSLGEAALPPPPPSTVFDSRLELPDGTTYSYKDYRTGTQYHQGNYTYHIVTQTEAGATEYTVSWVLPTGVTGTLRDVLGGVVVDEPMTGTGSYTVTNVAIDELLMIMTYDLLVAPDTPTLNDPTNGATNVPISKTFVWSAGGTVPVDTYRLEIATDAGFTNLVYDQSGLTAASQAVTLTDYNTLHYWRVTATNTKGSTTSAEWSFTTQPEAPPAPTLSYPANGATDIPNTLTFLWNASTGASWYLVEVSTDPGFGTTVYSDTAAGTFEEVTLTGFSTQFYWRVTAGNGTGSNVSAEWSFTTSADVPAAPTLTAPLDGATDVALAPTFTWSASTGATSYQIQVSDDAGFSNIVIDQAGLSTISFTPGSDFNTSTQYWWRVYATNGNGTSAASTEWDFTTVPPAPGAPTLVAPANNAVNLNSNVTFDWDPVTGADTYTLEYNGTTIANIPNTTTDLTTTLSDNTVYDWTVTAVNAGGSAQSVQWTFTTAPAAPTAVTLLTPIDGAIDQSVTPTLDWEDATGAYEYQLVVATDASFSNIVINATNLTTSQYTVSTALSTSTQYFWRVTARNGNGAVTSAEWDFTTVPPGPGQFTLIAPADFSTNQPVNNLLCEWTASNLADTYTIEIATDDVFSNVVYTQSGLTGTTHTVSGLQNNQLYYWHVIAYNAAGNYGSPVWEFSTIIAAPAVPTLVSPVDGATDVALSPTLTWSSVTGAATYHLQVATDAGFTNIIFEDATLTGTSQQVGPLTESTQYFWRVQAENVGGASGFTAEWDFTTVPPAPGAFSLVAPTDGATDQPVDNLTFEWGASTDAVTYTLEIATDPGFTTVVYTNSALTGTTDVVSGLANSTLHYWRVTAVNPGGTTASADWTFTTIIATPAVPTLVSPANNATDVALSPTLEWSSVPGAATYHLQVATDAGFTNIVFEDATLTDTTQQVGPLTESTQYFWRVQAENVGGASGFTSEWNFTTVPPAPGAFTLTAPSDGATDQPVDNLTFEWGASSDAATYTLEIATDAGFTTVVYTNAALTGTTDVVSGLANGTLHYWRVTAVNAGGTTASADWSFTTIVAAPSVPTLVSPVDGSTAIPTTPTLVWNAVSGADTYHLQVATDAGFTAIVFEDATLTGTSQSVGPLMNNTQYFWRVQAENVGGASGFSGEWDFTTEFEAIPAPSNFVASTMPNEPKKVYLTWTDNATNETGFYLERKMGDSTSTVEGTYAVIDTLPADLVAYVDTFNLQDTTLYTYRLQAFNSDTLSGYSNQTEVQTLIPVELTSFTASNSGTIISVNWETATEINNKGFEVERNLVDDPESKGWQSIGFVEGMGTTTEKALYSIDDELKYVSYKGVIQYRLKQIDFDGSVNYVDPIEVDVDFTPKEFTLYQNYPNPFNPSTTIKFALPEKTDLTISVYNMLGEKVAELFTGILEEGYHEVTWDGTSMTSGVYFYQVQSGKYNSVKKMLLIK